MIYDPNNPIELQQAKDKLNHFVKIKSRFELKQKKNTRSARQNSSLHLLFTIISDQLNEMGVEFQYFGLKGQVLSLRHTPTLVKEYIWRRIQIAMFDIESTTKINTEQINQIVDVLAKYFGEKGIVIEFPSKETLERMINN